jgi:tryptophan 2,3-dioxygenase
MAKTPGREGRSQAPVYYASYLKLDRLLSSQERESERAGAPAHDEMLFIIVHQAYELWFKQILFELDAIEALFDAPNVADRDLGRIVRGLDRIVAILKLLVAQFEVLETMTPLDFLEFRDRLFPASGFQSVQFRQIEARLGLKRQHRLNFDDRPYDSRLAPADREQVVAAEARPDLGALLDRWLARTPFVEHGSFRFREAYRKAVLAMLAEDARTARANLALGEGERRSEAEQLDEAAARFAAIFDEQRHRAMQEAGVWRLSWRALQAAVLINLYRDEPVLQLPFRLLAALMDIDEELTTWRNRHALLVQRMIGMKLGTGGSSGHDYLRAVAERHRVFGDLFALSTFLIPRSRLPALPAELRRAMGFGYAEGAP